MKKRVGFISNSSSSSFIICTNDDLEDVLIQEWENIFYGGNGPARQFVYAMRTACVNDLMYHNCDEPVKFASYEEFKNYVKDNWFEPISDSEEAKMEQMFKQWKYVSQLTIPDSGDGGSAILSALRGLFPTSFENGRIKIEVA